MTSSDAQISKWGAISENSSGISYLKNLKTLNFLVETLMLKN